MSAIDPKVIHLTPEQKLLAQDTVAQIARSAFIEYRRDPVEAVSKIRTAVDGATDALIAAFHRINAAS